MIDEKLRVAVTYDPARGYVASHPDLRPFVASSLNRLRCKIEASLMPDDVHVVFDLDRGARLERDRRRTRQSANG